MKDIEKIKSEDLGCQVADANPGNFAIEQEVAQLVGATVPAPTEPSADDARELGAQLLVFLRRALTPIQTALRTAVAAIYAHLDSRCTDYTPAAYAPYMPLPPYDPMRPFVPRTLPNLLTALTAFSARKISGVPEAADGISLVHLLCDTSEITELTDDNTGWTYSRDIFSLFPNVTKATLLCKDTLRSIAVDITGLEELNVPYLSGDYSAYHNNVNTAIIVARNLAITRLEVPGAFNIIAENARTWQVSLALSCANLEEVICGTTSIYCDHANSANGAGFIANNPVLKKVVFTGLKTATYRGGNAWYTVYNNPLLEEVDLSELGYYQRDRSDYFIYQCPSMKKLVLGTMTHFNASLIDSGSTANLIDLRLGEGTSCNLPLSEWSPTLDSSNLDQFLQNFREHIALRLTANGSGKTLTLSQAVFDTIWNQDGTPKSTDPDSVIYQINKIIKTDKHWSVNRA